MIIRAIIEENFRHTFTVKRNDFNDQRVTREKAWRDRWDSLLFSFSTHKIVQRESTQSKSNRISFHLARWLNRRVSWFPNSLFDRRLVSSKRDKNIAKRKPDLGFLLKKTIFLRVVIRFSR